MINILLACIYFFLPGYIANAVPPLIKKFNFLNYPLDFNQKINGKPILGSHKTFRGAISILIVGTLLTVLFFAINSDLHLYELIGFNYESFNPWFFGLLFSFSIVFGDLLFAFIKRRLNIKSGTAFIPFDQTNYVIGAFLILQPIIKLPIEIWITSFILTFFIHSIFNRLGYMMGLHNAKW